MIKEFLTRPERGDREEADQAGRRKVKVSSHWNNWFIKIIKQNPNGID